RRGSQPRAAQSPTRAPWPGRGGAPEPLADLRPSRDPGAELGGGLALRDEPADGLELHGLGEIVVEPGLPRPRTARLQVVAGDRDHHSVLQAGESTELGSGLVSIHAGPS